MLKESMLTAWVKEEIEFCEERAAEALELKSEDDHWYYIGRLDLCKKILSLLKD